MTGKALAYIVAEFPSQTETFILKEVLYVNELIPLYVIVLKKGKSQMDRQVYETFANRIVYMPQWWSWEILSHTIMNVNILYKKIAFNNLRRIKVLLISSYITEKIRIMQVGHVHAHFANYPADVAMKVSELSGIPFSFTAHANDIYVNPSNFPEKILKAKFVATCTKYNKDRLDAMILPTECSKIHLVYHGVDMNYWRFRQPEPIKKPIRILTIGRLIEKKGIVYLLEAVRDLLEKDIPVQLHIVGKGKEERHLKHFCRKFGLEQAVVFMGWQQPEQIRNLYLHSDIFVLPSVIASNGDRDGIPNVVLEAMAIGVPVISTSVSGIPEVIQDWFNGLLVPERDSQQLAHTIYALTFNRQLRDTFVKNAHETVMRHFDSNKCNQILIRLFENALYAAFVSKKSDTVPENLTQTAMDYNPHQFGRPMNMFVSLVH